MFFSELNNQFFKPHNCCCKKTPNFLPLFILKMPPLQVVASSFGLVLWGAEPELLNLLSL